MTEQLPIHCLPKSGESILGYICRLLRVNFYDDPRWLLGQYEVRYPQFGLSDQELITVSALTGLPVSALSTLGMKDLPETVRIGRIELHKTQIARNRVRVCPCCMRDDDYHRLLWTVRAYAACHRHGCLLLEQCPSCLSDLSWTKGCFDACDCGYKLSEAVGSTATEVQINAAARIAVAFEECEVAGAKGLLDELQEVPFRDALQAAQVIGRYRKD